MASHVPSLFNSITRRVRSTPIRVLVPWVGCVSLAFLSACGDRGPISFRLGDAHKLSSSVEVFNDHNSCVVFAKAADHSQLIPDPARPGCIDNTVFRTGNLVVGAVITDDDLVYFFSLNLTNGDVAIFDDFQNLKNSPLYQAFADNIPPVASWSRGSLFRK